MNNEKIGKFISELRKSSQMTQKELAAKLNITDKAVSKWERGLSCPDISLLSSIAEIFGVTTGELLNGEKNDGNTEKMNPEKMEESIDNALQYADKTARNRAKSVQNICAFVFSLLLLAGIVVCAICDLAISGSFTWSLYPISSILFGWLVFFPVIKFGTKGILGTLIALSVLIFPFLFVLDRLIKVSDLILPIGIRMAVISVVLLWAVFLLFSIWKTRKLMAASISLLLVIPANIIINFTLSKIISEPFFDMWDIMVFSIIVLAAVFLFAMDTAIRKKTITA